MYRRFGFLQSRLLLDKQDELRILEEKLDEMDAQDKDQHEKRLRTRDLRENDAKPRRELLKNIEDVFCQYVKILVAAQKLLSFNRPSSSDYRSVRQYIADQRPLCDGPENDWIHWKEDLITLRNGRDRSWLDVAVERLIRLCGCTFVINLFRSEETRRKTDKEEVVLLTASRIDRVVALAITTMVLILLIVPIYVLYHLINNVGTEKSYAICIGVLLVSTLAFSAVLSLFTRAKRHEILAAAAAYCAVLVVFIGNIGPRHASARHP